MKTLGRGSIVAMLACACVGTPPQPPGASGDDDDTTGASSGSMLPTATSTTLDSTVDTTVGTVGDADMVSTGPLETSTTTATGSESSGTPVMEEILENAPLTDCDRPLWCYINELTNPAGGPIWAQECFTASLPPPFLLTEVEVVIRGLHPELSDVRLQIYDRDETGPAGLSRELFLDASTLVVGTNVIELPSPVEWTQPELCVGLAAPGPDLTSALGVSVDESSNQPGSSYLRLEASMACHFPSWVDVVDAGATPSGNWCIRATIQTLP